MTREKLKLVYVIATILLMVSLSGCGKKNNDTSKEPEAEVTQEDSSSEAKDSEDESQISDDEATASDTTREKEAEETAIPTQEEAPTVASLTEEEINSIHLKDIYEEYGITLGTCLTNQMIANKADTDIITAQFNSVTMENLMKPDYIFNQKKSQDAGDLVVEFNDDTKALLQWAKDNGMKMRGHTLVWYSQTPSWIFYDNFTTSGKYVDRDTMLKRMDSYIHQVFKLIDELGYTDLFYAYDVVNEGLMEDGNLRTENNPWYQIIGDDYIWYAFYYANQYAPESISLFYNDYNEQYKMQAIIDLVNSLKTEDGTSLIDGIGLQAHLYMQDSLPDYLNAVKAFCSLGIQIQVTELDLGLGSWKKADVKTDETLRQQGQRYYELLKGILDLKQETGADINSITFWGFTDRLSWRSGNYPLLYDGDLKEKYSFFAAAQMKDYAGYEE